MFDGSWISVFALTGPVALLVAGCGFNLKAPNSAPSQTVSEVAPGPPALSQASTPPPDGVYTEFDGKDIRVHVGTIYGSSAWRSSVLHAKQSASVDSRVENHSEHAWTLSGPSTPFDDGQTIVVRARWNDDNADDYLAGGWVRDDRREATAFIDGPELRGDLPESISLPLKGQAIYRGEAAGYYESASDVACPADGPCPAPPTGVGTGEFSADATLWADFAHGTIEGCVGCQDGIEMTPTSFDDESGAVERRESESFTLNYLLWLHTGSFLVSARSLGSFNSDMSAIAHAGSSDDDVRCLAVGPPCEPEDGAGTTVGWGSWSGRLSNVDDKGGDPRLVGATLEGRFNHDNGDADFTGYLIADSTAHGGRDVSDDERKVRESKRILGVPEPPPPPTLHSTGGAAGIPSVDGEDDYVYHRWGIWGGTLREDAVTCTAIGCPPGGDALFWVYLNHQVDGTFTRTVQGERSGSSPTSGNAVWTGNVRAHATQVAGSGTTPTMTYSPVEGESRLEVDLAAGTVDVDFTSFDNDRADISWSELALDDGEFGSETLGIDGSFYGASHEGAAGTFDRDGLAGVFGALRASVPATTAVRP